MWSKYLQYYLPATALLFWAVTINRVVVTEDGGYDRLYGFPFAFRSNAFACSFCYEVYVWPLLLDLLIDFVVVFLLFKALEKVGVKARSYRFSTAIGLLLIFFSLFWFCLLSFDSSFKLENKTPFKLVSQRFVLFNSSEEY
jgi:hypothetical protein